MGTLPVSPGAIIDGKYRIVRLLGEGGMGAVYEGENLRICRRVAIKVLRASYGGQGEAVERFEREAQAAGQIGSDHIVQVYDLGNLEGGDHYMVLEYLDGETLGARLQRVGRLTALQVLPLARQLLVGLASAHASGIVHRDLKPDNIFILREKVGVPDFVKIIDFGVSKFDVARREGHRLTRTGTVLGTPYYLSPEQARGARVDQRSDIYAVGVILYQAIAGRIPFESTTLANLLVEVTLGQTPAPRTRVADLEPEFEAIIVKAMAVEPSLRFQSAQEFIDALDNFAARAGAGALAAARGPYPGVATAVQFVEAKAPEASPAVMAPEAPHPLTGPTSKSWASSQSLEVPSRSRTLIIAGGVLAVAAVGGIGLVMSWLLGPETTAAPPVPEPAARALAGRSALPAGAKPASSSPTPTSSAAPRIEAATQPVSQDTALSVPDLEPAESQRPPATPAQRLPASKTPTKRPVESAKPPEPTTPRRRDFGY